MNEIDKLFTASESRKKLQEYLTDQLPSVYDYFNNTPHSELIKSRHQICEFISSRRKTILSLETSNLTNLAFISLLLDISERLGLIAIFSFLFKSLKSTEFNIGHRLLAAAGYLIDVKKSEEYLNRFDSICTNLQIAFESEEDDAEKLLNTFINYYAKVIYDLGEFNGAMVIAFRQKVLNALSKQDLSFLEHPFISEVLKTEISSFETAYEKIHLLLDNFLGRKKDSLLRADGFLMEVDSEYSKLIETCLNGFVEIRAISTKLYKSLPDRDDIFRSLQRGVKILLDIKELYAYMVSYGLMHYEKIFSCIEYLPIELFNKEIKIIDWGCGQGLASMACIEFLSKNKIKHKIKSFTLIEPSKVSLERASLHISYYNLRAQIITINKEFDDLKTTDLFSKAKTPVIHLFSNVLDIEKFSLAGLLELISQNINGENYFVCASPYINDIKTARLDTFVNHFMKKDSFRLIKVLNNRRGEWKNGWTRVVRVFKVTL